MIVHHSFTRIQGQIGIREGRHTFKFCGHCGYWLRGETNNIKQHFKHFHDGNDHGWLKYGEMPNLHWYSNLKEHFENPEIKLVLR